MGLQDEIDRGQKQVKTDAYAMSIGELVSMYKEKEIEIHPAYQRYFRWSPEQKSRLLDSLFLGIPLPSIFVAQRQNGVWEVVDGLQRIGTLLQLVGVLRDPDGTVVPPLILRGTKYLPSLEGKRWKEEPEGANNGLSQAQKLFIKRAKIDIKIVLRGSDPSTKHELFDRLNTGGSKLSAAEVRNCLLVMSHPDIASWMDEVANEDAFKSTVQLSEGMMEQRYDLDMIARFLAFRAISLETLATKLEKAGDLSELITNLLLESELDLSREREAFDKTFTALSTALSDNTFRKYDSIKGKWTGPFLISLYETLAIGLASAPEKIDTTSIEEFAKNLWDNPDFANNVGAGAAWKRRIASTIRVGRAHVGAT